MKVGIAVHNPADAKELAKKLPERFEVVDLRGADLSVVPTDVLIVDATTLEQSASSILARKGLDHPVYFPVLLASPVGPRGLASKVVAGIDIWDLVDEIVRVPVGKAELFLRISLLLKARVLSLQLESLRQDLRLRADKLEKITRLHRKAARVIVHELNNPLTVLLGGLPFLLNDLAAAVVPDQRPLWSEVLQAAIDSTNSIRFILKDLENLTSPTQPLSPNDRCDVVQVVRSVARNGNAFGKAKGVRFVVVEPPPDSQVSVEAAISPARLERVVLNLLSNAHKFSPPGSLVELSVREVGDFVQVAVKDHGVGVPEGDLPRLFKVGRLQTPGTRGEKGSGMGLHVCKRVVVAHGGRIWAERNPEGGTTFKFKVPRRWHQN
ncbi:MAG: hypothetical protein Kow0069_38780 [Promethearchaeota archaeon]